MKIKEIIIFLFSIYVTLIFLNEAESSVRNVKVNGPIETVYFTDVQLTIEALKKILSIEDYPLKRRLIAVHLLGKLKAEEAVDVLMDNLLLSYEGDKNFEELNQDNFPVGFALIQIGIPTRQPLLNKIKITEDAEVMRLCTFVIMKTEDKEIAKVVFEKAIQQERDIKKKENLNKALTYLK